MACRFSPGWFVVTSGSRIRNGGVRVELLVVVLLIGLTVAGGRWGHDSRVAGRQVP